MIDFTTKVKIGGFWSQSITGLITPTEATWHGVRTAEEIWVRNGTRDGVLWVTAFLNGQHTRLSEHKQGNAGDLRTRTLPGGYLGNAAYDSAEELYDSLHGEYTVILEDDHCHFHHEPGGGKLIFEYER